MITPLDEASVRRGVEAAVAGGAQAIAVCLLHSYANPAHEERIGALVREIAPQLYLTLSHQILREYREYERPLRQVAFRYGGGAGATFATVQGIDYAPGRVVDREDLSQSILAAYRKQLAQLGIPVAG